MTVRSISARRAPAAAGASLLTPVPRTGAVPLLARLFGSGLRRHLLLLFDGRVRHRDGRIRAVLAAFDGRIRAVLTAIDGRLRPPLTY